MSGKIIISVRLFPTNNRKSLSSMNIEIESKFITLKDFIEKYLKSILSLDTGNVTDTYDNYKFSKGVEFLNENSIIKGGDIINIIPNVVKRS
jgi:hypothetical protein